MVQATDYQKFVGMKFLRGGRIYTVAAVRSEGVYPVTVTLPDGFKADVRLDLLLEVIPDLFD